MARPKGSTNKRSFTKELLQQTEKAAKVVEVFEKHGFEVESMEQFQNIATDLMNVLSGTTSKRGRKPGRPKASESSITDTPKKRGPKPGSKRGKKRGRKPKVTISDLITEKRKPGRPKGKKRGRKPGKRTLESSPVTPNQNPE